MKKILIADPDHNVVLTLEKLLRAESYEVSVCGDLPGLMRLAGLHDFDLILVNALIKTDGGKDIIPYLQVKQPAASFMIILEDASTSRKTLPRIYDQVRKPLDFPAIVSSIKQLFDGGGFSGLITGISLADYVQMLCMNRVTKAILIKKDAHKGIILISDGRITYAEVAGFKGEKAFCQIISWRQGQIKEVKVKKFPPPNIDMDVQQLLLTASLSLDEAGEEQGQTVPGMGVLAGLKDQPEDECAGAAVPERGRPRGFVRKYAGIGVAVMVVLFVALTFFQQYAIRDEGRNGRMNPAVFSSGGRVSWKKSLQDRSADPENAQAADKGEAQKGGDPSGTGAAGKAFPGTAGGNAEAALPVGTAPADGMTGLVPQAGPPLAEETLLRLHGSNTIGAVLAPALVTAYLKTRLNAVDIAGVPGAQENEVIIRAMVNGRRVAVEIQAHGSATAFEDLKTGTCDIGDASRKIKEGEIEQLSFLGEMTSLANEHVVGLDGIAVIVNRGNILNQITVKDLQQVFAGRFADWQDLHGTKGTIGVYARDGNSGTYDTFKSIILGEQETLAAGARRYESNAELSDDVSRDPLGIGFTGLPYVRESKALAVSEEGALAIYPNFFTVATEDYPLSRRLYMYTASIPKNPNVAPFINFVLSAEGQKIVQESGFVDMNIRTFPLEPAEHESKDAPPKIREYLNSVKNANRLSLNFRFRKNETALDNRSMHDLDRIIVFLENKLDKRIVLAGFADNSGNYENNYRLAMARAQLVASELRARGISVGEIFSCGQENPVASNATEQGREKNRRVEVWLK